MRDPSTSDMTDRDRPRDCADGDARAVSDLVGFIGTFAVIITAVAIISTVGIGSLQEFQLHEQHNNAVRSMEAVADDLGQLQHGSATRRSTGIDLSVGRLRWIDDTSIRIETDTNAEYAIDPGSLRLELADTFVSYESGAVFRSDRSTNGVMKRAPAFVCRDGERAVVSVVELDGPEQRQVGSGTVQVTSVHERTDLLYPVNRTGANSSTAPTHVDVTIQNSPHARSWRTYFEREDNGWRTVDADTARCVVGGDGGVYVRKTVVNVSFVR